MKVLVLEASTSAAKAMLYCSRRGALARRVLPYGNVSLGLGQQDCLGVVDAVLDAGREVAAGQAVDAVALVGTWHSIAVLDGHMRPASPTYTWEYTASAAAVKRVRQDASRTRALYHNTGCVPHSTYPLYALVHQLPRLGLDAFSLASQSGYLFYTLTGQFAESVCTASGGGFVNLRTGQYDASALALAGIGANQLGELRTYRQTSPLTARGAARLGVQAGVPVLVGHGDGAMNQLCAAGTAPGIMSLSVGTSAAMRANLSQPATDDSPGLWCYFGAEGWISGAAVASCCNCVNWFVDELLGGRYSFEALEGPFSGEAPLFLPFLFGERSPGWSLSRQGGFYGLHGQTDPRALYYAIQEGICFCLKQCLDMFARRHGLPRRICLSGGILRSRRWAQLLAHILQVPLDASGEEQASLLGGALLAMAALGETPGLAPSPLAAQDSYLPGPDAFQRIAPRYQRYLRLYEALGLIEGIV